MSKLILTRSESTPGRIEVTGHEHEPRTRIWLEPNDESGYRACTDAPEMEDEARRIGRRAAMITALRAEPPVERPTWADLQRLARPASARRSPKRRPRADRWQEQDTETLDANRMSHPIPAPTQIRVSDEEPEVIVRALRAVHSLQVEVAPLERGDYEVLDEHGKVALVVRRLTVDEMVTDIQRDAGAFFEETAALRTGAAPAVILIQGDLYADTRMTLPQLAGALSYLATIEKLSLIPVLGPLHSVYLIAKLVRHAVHGLGYDAPGRREEVSR